MHKKNVMPKKRHAWQKKNARLKKLVLPKKNVRQKKKHVRQQLSVIVRKVHFLERVMARLLTKALVLLVQVMRVIL